MASAAPVAGPVITRGDPLSEGVARLLARHVALMRAISPPESVHVLAPADLAGPDIAFYTMQEGEQVIGMGALKRLPGGHGEIKSMHVAQEVRGRGLARRMLEHLVAEARAMGLTRLSLETGAEPEFAPARALYAAAGFRICPPFGNYRDDPNSVFMTCDLS
ncbi:GNAT family N-acetyltransferase [Allgaiera indica]|uniref:Acetyltransferase n=1 Tax=Allgaiera indica TaxID=765699 RepID=A0A1H2Z8G7_9RHOB|nr:putative acetyltransferase [Allgaiera indica]